MNGQIPTWSQKCESITSSSMANFNRANLFLMLSQQFQRLFINVIILLYSQCQLYSILCYTAFLSIKTNIVTILHTYYKCLLQHSIDFFNLIKINFYCCFICASLLLFLVSIKNIGFHSDIFPCIMNSAHIPRPIMFSCCPVNDGSPL